MNRYQKIIACVIRTFAVALLLYGIALTLVSCLLGGMMWRLGLFSNLPNFIVGLVLFVAAIPLAKLITLGIRDD